MGVDIRLHEQCEGLIDALGNFVPGGRDERRELLMRLLFELLEDGAKEFLAKKFVGRRKQTVSPLIEACMRMPEAWERKGLDELDAAKKAKAERKAGKKGGDVSWVLIVTGKQSAYAYQQTS